MNVIRKYAKSKIEQITGTGIGQRTRAFFRAIAWTYAGAFSARLLAGVATLLTARFLGPVAFGEANLALASSLWIQVPLFLGLPSALMHFIPSARQADKRLWSFTGMGLLALSSTGTLVMAFILKTSLSNWLGVPPRVFSWTLYWCAGFAIYAAGTALLSAKEQFSKRAWVEIAFAGLFLLLTLFLRISKLVTVGNYILSFSIAYAIAGIAGIAADRSGRTRSEDVSVDYQRVSHVSGKLIRYGLIASCSNVGNALFLASARLLANRCLNSNEVGLLAVYQAGSIQMASFMLAAAVQGFFPIASRTPDKVTLLKKMTNVILVAIIPCLIVLVLFLALYFKLLGKNYTFDVSNAMVYALAACCSFVFGILSWFYAAMGTKGLWGVTLVGLFSGGMNWAACQWLIPRFHVVGAAWAYTLGCSVGICILYLPAVQRWSGHTSENINF